MLPTKQRTHFYQNLVIIFSLLISLSSCGSGDSLSRPEMQTGPQPSNPPVSNIDQAITVPDGIRLYPDDKSIRLTWNSVSRAHTYRVYWSTLPDVSLSSQFFETSTNTGTHQSLNNGTEYYYQIQAITDQGASQLSEMVSAIPQSLILGQAEDFRFENVTLKNCGRQKIFGFRSRAVHNGTLWLMPGGEKFCISEDGYRWRTTNDNSGFFSNTVTWDGLQWLAISFVDVDQEVQLATSKNGIDWDMTPMIDDNGNSVTDQIFSVVWTGTQYVATGKRAQWNSPDGTIWTASYPADRPEPGASIFVSNGNILAIDSKQSRISTDGFNWQASTKDTKNGNFPITMATDGSLYVGGSFKQSWLSDDAINWRGETSSIDNQSALQAGLPVIYASAFYKGNFYGLRQAAGTGFSVLNRTKLYRSPDGINWTSIDHNLFPVSLILSTSNNQIIAHGTHTIATSENGTDWVLTNLGDTPFNSRLTWSGDRFILIGTNSYIHVSLDGIRWQWLRAPTGNGQIRDAIWTGSQYVAVGTNNDGAAILTSTDGKQWTTQDVSMVLTKSFVDINWNGSQFIALGQDNELAISTDGINWRKETVQGGAILKNLLWNGKEYFSTTARQASFSPDGINWTTHLINVNTNSARKFIWNGTHYIGINKDKILLSKDGINWISNRIDETNIVSLTDIAWTGKSLIATTQQGRVYQSVNGVDWQPQDWFPAATTGNISGVVWGDTMLLLLHSFNLYRGYRQ